MSSQPTSCIYLPASLVYQGKRLVPVSAGEFRSDITAAPGRRVIVAGGSNPKLQVTEILDRCGQLHRLIPERKRFAALGWLAPVWDFTKMECRIETIDPMPVGELVMVARKWTNGDGRRFLNYLKRQSPEGRFDEQMYRRVWPAISVALPEEEWRRQFVLIS